MKNWSKLILPLGLAVFAAILNATAMHEQVVPTELVSVKRDIAAGEKLSEGDLRKVLVPYPSSHLKDHFWHWSDRSQLTSIVGTPVPLKKGQLVARSDYLHYRRNLFAIPEERLLVGLRFGSKAIAPDEQQFVLPGRFVRLRFQGQEVESFEVAFLESLNSTECQIGVYVNPRESNGRQLLSLVHTKLERIQSN